jgi:hypothetical protein
MLVTQSEFARLAKVSRSAVCQAVKAGLITATETRDGKVYINKDEGLRQYENNSRRRNKPQPVPVTLPAETGLDMLSWGSAPSTTAQEAAPKAAQAPPGRPADDKPNYNNERALHERERRLIAEMDRRVKEGELVYRSDFVTAQNAVAAQIMNRAEALPRQIKQAIPHLLIEEVEKIERLIKEMMEGVANWTYDELDAEE